MTVQIKLRTTLVVTLLMYHFSFSFVHKDGSSPSRLLGLQQFQTEQLRKQQGKEANFRERKYL